MGNYAPLQTYFFKDWLSKIKDVNAMNFVATTIAAKLYINIFYFGQPVLKIVL